MKYRFFILFLLLICQEVVAIDIKVKLYSNKTIDKAIVTPTSTNYYLIALDDSLNPIDTIIDLYEESTGNTLYFTNTNGLLDVNRIKQSLGKYEALLLVSKKREKTFVISAAGKERIYNGNLQFRVYKGHLQIVNIVDLEQYVSGVVESEGGHIDTYEYFKAQAILARTFALKNWEKHTSEGYNLKDDVSSQAYYSKCYLQNKDNIIKATYATKDTVLVSKECDLILTAFHANSGGQTANSEDAWVSKVSYLRSKEDKYSAGQPSYTWEKKIDKKQFLSYFKRQFGVKDDDTAFEEAVLSFTQKSRMSYFSYEGKKLALKRVRTDFKLRSTYFSVEESGDNVILKGKGYGHGVGLSQDGAINMAQQGFTCKEILYYYYNNVELENLNFLEL